LCENLRPIKILRTKKERGEHSAEHICI
jgi:hypothetical protein